MAVAGISRRQGKCGAVRCTITEATSPTTADGEAAGHLNGDLWIRQDIPRVWVLANQTGSAVWVQIS